MASLWVQCIMTLCLHYVSFNRHDSLPKQHYLSLEDEASQWLPQCATVRFVLGINCTDNESQRRLSLILGENTILLVPILKSPWVSAGHLNGKWVSCLHTYTAQWDFTFTFQFLIKPLPSRLHIQRASAISCHKGWFIRPSDSTSIHPPKGAPQNSEHCSSENPKPFSRL